MNLNKKWTKDTWKRAGRTFIQSAIGYIAVNLAFVDFSADKDVITHALIGLCVSTFAAGLAGVMNLESTTETESEE